MLVRCDGLLFEVEGSYTPGTKDTRLEPGNNAELEIESISIGDQDVTDFLTKEQYGRIEDAAYLVFGECHGLDD